MHWDAFTQPPILLSVDNLYVLEDTAGYAGLLLAPAEGFGRGLFCPWGKKKKIIITGLAHIWQFLVSNRNLCKESQKNGKKNPKKIKLILKKNQTKKYKKKQK